MISFFLKLDSEGLLVVECAVLRDCVCCFFTNASDDAHHVAAADAAADADADAVPRLVRFRSYHETC